MIKIVAISALALLIIACKEEKKDPPKSDFEIKWEKQKQLDTLNYKQALQFANSYGADFGWDTTFTYTYFLQEKLENTGKPVAFIGEIRDILKNDSTYFLKIVSTNSLSYFSYMAELTVSTALFKELRTQLKTNKPNEGCFVFNATKINSQQPVLTSEVVSNGQNVEDATSDLTFDYDENLVKFNGKLLAYKFYKRFSE